MKTEPESVGLIGELVLLSVSKQLVPDIEPVLF
jgi:hypothetical protein